MAPAMAAVFAAMARHPRLVAGWVGLLAALMWGVTIHSIAGQVGKPFPGFFCNPERVVSGFTPEDFSGWQAGLRPWDTVVAVDGRHWREMPTLVQQAGVGGTLVYTIERNGATLDIAVPTMEFTADIAWGILPSYFLLSLVFLVVGVFVYLCNPRGRLNVFLLMYLFVWAIGGSIVWEAYLSQAKYLSYLLAPYAVAAPVAGWIFLWSFPADETRRKFLARWPLIPAFIALAVVTIVAVTVLHALADILDERGLWSTLAWITGWPYFVAFGLSSIVLKALPLAIIALRPGNPLLRHQAMVMIVGLVLGLSGWYLFLWAPAAVHVPPLARTAWGGIVPTLYPLSIGYAILRYQMLDIRVVVRKGLVYSLLTAALTAPYLLLALLTGYLFHEISGRQSLLAMLFPALLVAFLFQPVRSRIQALVDRAFFRRDYEVRATLARFGRALSVLRGRDELAQLILATVCEVLGAANACLWLPGGGRYVCVGSAPSANGIAAGGPLAGWLARERRAFLPLVDDDSPPAEELRRLGAVLALPFLSGERMVGILTLATKRSGDLYSSSDLDLLGTLAPSTALALENARLHEERLEMERQRFEQAAAIQEDERRRIAQELHDGIGPSLASLRIRLHTVQRTLEREHNSAAGEVGELAAQVQSDIRDIRRLIDDLRPAVLDQLGLTPALREYVSRFQADHNVTVTLVDDDFETLLPAALETALFRIAQEALANVAKHARARSVEVKLRHDGDRITLAVIDDGGGFDPRSGSPGTHVGLWSIQKRVEQLGGEYCIRSAPGQGTSLAVTFPCGNEAGR